MLAEPPRSQSRYSMMQQACAGLAWQPRGSERAGLHCGSQPPQRPRQHDRGSERLDAAGPDLCCIMAQMR